MDGYVRNPQGDCFSVETNDIALHSSLSNLRAEKISDQSSPTNKSIPVTRKPLTVKAESKIVQLPENEATLFATVEPANEELKYQFDWTILHQPDGSTAVQHKSEGKMHLEKLTEGTYAFRVR